MQFCDDHWQRLREKIKEHGLEHLVIEDSETAAMQLRSGLEKGRYDRTNFCPLMAAHWAIITNLTILFHDSHNDDMLLVMMSQNAPFGGCPLCTANDLHDRQCDSPTCPLDPVERFDYMLELAARDSEVNARELGLI